MCPHDDHLVAMNPCRSSLTPTTMASSPSSHPNLQERDMTRNQRGLVETCFEEGQYESGIAVFEQLRSEKFKPPV